MVPVDFSDNTEIAVKKAIEMACTSGTTIYLLHVIKSKSIWQASPFNNSPVPGTSKNDYQEDSNVKLQQWKRAIEETIPYTIVETLVMEGAINDGIIEAAKQVKPQLIIIGKRNGAHTMKFFSSVHPNRIAKSTGCPVLTVLRGSFDAKIKIIVIPVSSFIPRRKIELVRIFAEKYRAKIDLVALHSQFWGLS